MNNVRRSRRLSREFLTKLATGAEVASVHVSESRVRAERVVKESSRPLSWHALHKPMTI